MLGDSEGNVKTKFLKRMGRVASYAFQDWAVNNASESEYVLLDEVLDVAVGAALVEATNPVLSRKWSEGARQALLAFATQGSRLVSNMNWGDSAESIDLVLRSAGMVELRRLAQQFLDEVDVSFDLQELIDD